MRRTSDAFHAEIDGVFHFRSVQSWLNMLGDCIFLLGWIGLTPVPVRALSRTNPSHLEAWCRGVSLLIPFSLGSRPFCKSIFIAARRPAFAAVCPSVSFDFLGHFPTGYLSSEAKASGDVSAWKSGSRGTDQKHDHRTAILDSRWFVKSAAPRLSPSPANETNDRNRKTYN